VAPARFTPLISSPAALARAPYGTGAIAHKLGKSSDWFYRHRAQLQAEHAMPAPLPGPGHPRWRRDLIDAWLAGYLPQVPANDATVQPEPDWRIRLAVAYRRAP